MGKDHAQPMDVDPTASQKENTFANVVAQEELPCQDVNELILRFKRKGIFDEMRKVAFAEFKESVCLRLEAFLIFSCVTVERWYALPTTSYAVVRRLCF